MGICASTEIQQPRGCVLRRRGIADLKLCADGTSHVEQRASFRRLQRLVCNAAARGDKEALVAASARGQQFMPATVASVINLYDNKVPNIYRRRVLGTSADTELMHGLCP